MRLRKSIAILMMILANVFILVHAVVPHCHRDGVICFNPNQIQQEENCHQEHDCSHHEEETNQGRSHLDLCNIPQMIERTGNSLGEDLSFLLKDLGNEIGLSFFYSCSCYLAIKPELPDKKEYYELYSNFYKSPYAASHTGLRAPPVI